MQMDHVINFGQINSAHYQLTQAELLFSLRALNLPDIPGVGEKPWGEMELDEAQRSFRTAGLTLKERGWVWLDDNTGQPMVEPALQSILSACAYPLRMMALVYRIAPAAPVEVYHYRREELTVRHTLPQDLLHDFQSVTDSDMGSDLLAGLFKGFSWTFESPAKEVSLATYDQAMKLIFTDAEKARQYLIESGLAPEICASFTNVVRDHKIHIQAQWVYQFNPVVNQNSVTFFAGDSACWLVEKVAEQKLTRMKAINSASIGQLLQSAFNGF